MLLITHDGNNKGIVATEDALRMAREQRLDLVQMTQEGEPIVCRIMDYGKHQFTKRKQHAVARRKQHRMQVKEVKFRVATEAADYQVKLLRLQQFLGHGDKVKITLRYRGREMMHQDLGLRMLERVRDDLSEIGFVEHDPELERRQLSMVIAPYRKGQRGSKHPATGAKPLTTTVINATSESAADTTNTTNTEVVASSVAGTASTIGGVGDSGGDSGSDSGSDNSTVASASQ